MCAGARDALVKRHTLEKVFGQLTQRQLALDENVTYNEILVCICRILKASNQALNFPIDQIRAVFSIVSTEGIMKLLIIFIIIIGCRIP